MRDPTPATSLSRDGERRREQILRLAVRAAAQRGQRRRARRVAGLILFLVTAACIGVRFHHATATGEAKNDPQPLPHPPSARHPPTPERNAPPVVAVTPAQPARPEIVITRIQTDPGLTDRLAIPRDAPAWQRLTDDDLLRRLSDAGKPAGLAYVDGRAMLLFRDGPHEAGRASSPPFPHWRTASPPDRHAQDSQPF
jgi:hypothetical protein